MSIEIIDIECVLLSLFGQKFVAIKWLISKGILSRPNLLWQGISLGFPEVHEIVFSNNVFLKSLKSRYKLKKKVY